MALKKNTSIKTLKRKLDDIFSIFIRLRDSDNKGYCKCISCSKMAYYKEMDCGHFVNRSHMNTRYDEQNCNAQCRSCNRFDEGNNIGYAKGLVKKYGSQIIDILYIKKNTANQLKSSEYQILIDYYSKEVSKLKQSKTLKQ